jgi:hypothetical protein
MFVQHRDGISPAQIAELYDALPMGADPKAKHSARAAADGLKAYLAKPLGITIYEDVLTNGRLFEVFMYGDLAHANDDKRTDYEKWMKHPLAAPLLPRFFDEIVGVLLRGLLSFHTMNERSSCRSWKPSARRATCRSPAVSDTGNSAAGSSHESRLKTE